MITCMLDIQKGDRVRVICLHPDGVPDVVVLNTYGTIVNIQDEIDGTLYTVLHDDVLPHNNEWAYTPDQLYFIK